MPVGIETKVEPATAIATNKAMTVNLRIDIKFTPFDKVSPEKIKRPLPKTIGSGLAYTMTLASSATSLR
jgi:hypothetical protein